MTHEQHVAGLLSEPLSIAEMDELYGKSRWRFVPRFLLHQSAKTNFTGLQLIFTWSPHRTINCKVHPGWKEPKGKVCDKQL